MMKRTLSLYGLILFILILASITPVYASTCADESFAVTGNVTIQAMVGNSITVISDNVGNETLTTQGGTIILSADGSFSYDPPTGFVGDDSVSYTVDDAGTTKTCTITFNVQDMIWFIDSFAPADVGDGSLDKPFRSIAEFNNSASGTGDTIFIYDRDMTYRGGLILQDEQILIGMGASESLSTLTGIIFSEWSVGLPSTTANNLLRPQLQNLDGAAITLASNNSIYGIEIADTSDYGMIDSGVSVGLLKIQESSVSGAGGILNLSNGGMLSANFDSLTTNSSVSGGIILNGIGGAVTSSVTTISGASGASIQIDNSQDGAFFDFGTLNITTTSGIALAGTNNNSALIQSETCNAIRATNFAAIKLDNSVINITCATISAANSSSDGVRLDLVSGQLTVTNSFNATLLNSSTGAGLSIRDSLLSGNLGTTSISHSGVGDGVYMDNTIGNIVFSKLSVTVADGNALKSHNHSGELTITDVMSELSTSRGACADIEGSSATLLTMQFSTCRTSGGVDHAINLVGVSGTLFRVASNTTLDMQENSSQPIFIQDVSTQQIDIGKGDTTTYNLIINGRRADAIYIERFSGEEIRFGNVTIAPVGEAVSGNGVTFMDSSGNANFNYLSIDMLNAAQTIPETMYSSGDLPNSIYNDGNGILIINNSGYFIVDFGASISNTPNEGIFAHSSAGLLLNDTKFANTGGHNLLLLNMQGESIFNKVTFASYGAEYHGVYIAHYLSTNSNYVFTDSVWADNPTSEQAAFLLETRNSESLINLSINESQNNACRFEDHNTALHILAGNSENDKSQVTTLVDGCTFSNTGQIVFEPNYQATQHLQFSNNEISNSGGIEIGNLGILALTAHADSSMYATLENNKITGGRDSTFHGLSLIMSSDKTSQGDFKVNFSNNSIDDTYNGIYMRFGGQATNGDIEIRNNRIGTTNAIHNMGILIEVGINSDIKTQHHLLIDGNDIGAANRLTELEGIRMDINGNIEFAVTLTNNILYSGLDAFELNAYELTSVCLDLRDNTVFDAGTESFDIDSGSGAAMVLEGEGTHIVTGLDILSRNQDFDGSGVGLGAYMRFNDNTDCTMPSGPYQ